MRVQLSRTRLEPNPWRLVWRCQACEKTSRWPAPDDLVEAMLGMQRPGGVAVSFREVREFAKADADEFEAAVRDELLP